MLYVYVIEPYPEIVTQLQGQNEISLCGSLASTAEWDRRQPPGPAQSCDLVLVSAKLPALQITQFLHENRHTSPPIVITDVDETTGAILPFLEAGAAGYVPRGTTVSNLVSILTDVTAGKPPLAPTVGTALVERLHELLALQQQQQEETLLENCPDLTALTAREREILRLIRDGASNQAIAAGLMIELGTVKNHVHNILKKLNVSRREQAASYVDLLEQVNP